MLRFSVKFQQIPDDGRTDKRVFEFRHQINRFDVGIKRVIQISQLQFKFEIADGAEPPYQYGSSERIGKFYREIVKSDNRYTI